MQKYRHILGMTKRRGRVVASAMINHHSERLAWAQENRRAPIATWVHSDESTPCMRDTGDFVWAPTGRPTPPIEVEKLRCSFNVWGAVWETDRLFVQYDHLAAVAYIELLRDNLLPEKENIGHRIYLLDRNATHTAKRTQEWLTEHGFAWKILPTHLPKFSGVEQCWAWIKDRVRAPGPTPLPRMQADLESAFDALSQQAIDANLQHAQHAVRQYAQVRRK